MNQHELDIKVKPAEEAQLGLLHDVFSTDNMTKPQHRRYDIQKRGEGVYLIAWYYNTPIGHFLLRWSGPNDGSVTKYINVTQNAFLEAGLTIDEYRGKGVATAIIKEAERLAKEKGCAKIGLEVGIDNTTAKRLYEKLGYRDWGHGNFLINWTYIDKYGNERIDTEIVAYLLKSL